MSFWTESGWTKTPAAGVLDFLLYENPGMSYADVIAWAAANGLPDWSPTLDQDDDQSPRAVALDGKIRWDDNYPYPSNFQALYNEWKEGAIHARMPDPPPDPAQVAQVMNAGAAASSSVDQVAAAPIPTVEPVAAYQTSQLPINEPVAPSPVDTAMQTAILPNVPAAPQPSAPSPIDIAMPPAQVPAAPQPTFPSVIPGAQQIIADTADEAARKAALVRAGLVAGLLWLIF